MGDIPQHDVSPFSREVAGWTVTADDLITAIFIAAGTLRLSGAPPDEANRLESVAFNATGGALAEAFGSAINKTELQAIAVAVALEAGASPSDVPADFRSLAPDPAIRATPIPMRTVASTIVTIGVECMPRVGWEYDAAKMAPLTRWLLAVLAGESIRRGVIIPNPSEVATDLINLGVDAANEHLKAIYRDEGRPW